MQVMHDLGSQHDLKMGGVRGHVQPARNRSRPLVSVPSTLRIPNRRSLRAWSSPYGSRRCAALGRHHGARGGASFDGDLPRFGRGFDRGSRLGNVAITMPGLKRGSRRDPRSCLGTRMMSLSAGASITMSHLGLEALVLDPHRHKLQPRHWRAGSRRAQSGLAGGNGAMRERPWGARRRAPRAAV